MQNRGAVHFDELLREFQDPVLFQPANLAVPRANRLQIGPVPLREHSLGKARDGGPHSSTGFCAIARTLSLYRRPFSSPKLSCCQRTDGFPGRPPKLVNSKLAGRKEASWSIRARSFPTRAVMWAG